ncbi:Signal transduction histidine kinase [hydrothermal vent metagenome]|uniref:Signal transduction histidine kinase n=1 Tax=hydrothermal vent metagenome TaxID=652676 RepID=A0A1W1CN43_9ZZZZ
MKKILLFIISMSQDDSLTKEQELFLLYIGILMSFGGILWGSITLYYGLYFQASIPLTYSVITFFNFLYMNYSKNFETAKSIQLLISLALPFLFQLSLGGFIPSGSVILWSTLAVFGALTYKESTSVRTWMVLFVVIIIVSAVLDNEVAKYAIDVPVSISTLLFAINIIAVMLILFGLLFYFIESEKKLKIVLADSLETLTTTQKQLVENEKMASLGGLVAGVAHEINTPIGVSVTAASLLKHTSDEFVKLYEAKTVKQSDFENFISIAGSSTGMILQNLERAASLINSFKSISVDQTSGELREINIKGYINSIILSLHNKIKKTQHEVVVECDENLMLNIKAGEVAQVVSNLIDNSLLHAFPNIDIGHILVKVEFKHNILHILYKDDGIGLNKVAQKKFFEPFFTTKRNKGGSGLGTHIIYNIVTHSFGGKIELKSEENEGIEINMYLPIEGAHNV